jgi:hypothetical protein
MSVFHTRKEARQGSESLILGESRRGHDPPLTITYLLQEHRLLSVEYELDPGPLLHYRSRDGQMCL